MSTVVWSYNTFSINFFFSVIWWAPVLKTCASARNGMELLDNPDRLFYRLCRVCDSLCIEITVSICLWTHPLTHSFLQNLYRPLLWYRSFDSKPCCAKRPSSKQRIVSTTTIAARHTVSTATTFATSKFDWPKSMASMDRLFTPRSFTS